MAIYSKPAKLAIHILRYIADQNGEQLCTARDLAIESGVSEPTVAKVLQALAKDGILDSRKGPGGGFRMVHPASEISLWRIVTAIEGSPPLLDCVGGFEECSELNPCPLHEKWKVVKAELVSFLEETSLKDIVIAAHKTGH
jgi:Rrf2 family protein